MGVYRIDHDFPSSASENDIISTNLTQNVESSSDCGVYIVIIYIILNYSYLLT